ncbi:MAG: hypothetical protein ACI85K_001820 [Hyphomicrobiaceae bacterium]|jgi:hypothetical protein
MANHFRSALLGLLSVVSLSAQEALQSNAHLPVVVSPAGYQTGDWVPTVVVWCTGDERRAVLAGALTAVGLSVVQLHSAPGSAELQKIMGKLRQRIRIAQGGVHAVIESDANKAVAAVLANRQEFQTVTLCGAAADVKTLALRRLPKRRVQALATNDAGKIAAHLKALHEQRVVAGVAGEVHQVLDSFHDAAAVGDEDRYFAILPDDAVFLGTDATERWTGKQFRSFAMRYFKQPSAWTYVPLERHVTLSANGKLAWFDEALDNAGYGECRGTGVLQKRDGRWVLLQYNLTVPVPNDLMGGVAKKIRAYLDSPRGAGKK